MNINTYATIMLASNQIMAGLVVYLFILQYIERLVSDKVMCILAGLTVYTLMIENTNLCHIKSHTIAIYTFIHIYRVCVFLGLFQQGLSIKNKTKQQNDFDLKIRQVEQFIIQVIYIQQRYKNSMSVYNFLCHVLMLYQQQLFQYQFIILQINLPNYYYYYCYQYYNKLHCTRILVIILYVTILQKIMCVCMQIRLESVLAGQQEK
eukprot:TRINITY_DN10508_c0_g1_i2.p2 TRINITY_DN10508_c0_g1~~TRINITY_DN10508_c0_g1_i2.p2  ORF type:complete len:206 (+),score=-16.91 TRINITY_DN10508_c0_g1_i2:1467-2084(+)